MAWALPAYDPQAFTQHWLRNHVLLKAVHLVALGQLGLLFLAVQAQALPVLFHQPQPAKKWPLLLGLGLWIFGVLSLVAFFAGWRNPALLGAAWVCLALAWFLLYLRAGSLRAQSESAGFAWNGLGPAFLYLALMLVLGGAMAWNLIHPVLESDVLSNLQLHVHLGLWGFAGMAIFGFLPKLLRLFQGSVGYAGWPLNYCLSAVHGSLALLLGIWLGWLRRDWAGIAGWGLLLAAFLFAWQLTLLLVKAKKSSINSSLLAQVAGLIFLLAAAAWDARLLNQSAPWQEHAAALALGMGGFINLTLLGTTQRISAVLAWFQRFYDLAKTHQVPTAWELAHPALAWAVTPLQALAAAALAWGLLRGDAVWIRMAGLSGVVAHALTLALSVGALRRGQARPWPNGKNPFIEWVAEQEAKNPA